MVCIKEAVVSSVRNHKTCVIGVENLMDVMNNVHESSKDYIGKETVFTAYSLVQLQLFIAVQSVMVLDMDGIIHTDTHKLLAPNQHKPHFNCSETVTLVNLLNSTIIRIEELLDMYATLKNYGTNSELFKGIRDSINIIVIEPINGLIGDILELDHHL